MKHGKDRRTTEQKDCEDKYGRQEGKITVLRNGEDWLACWKGSCLYSGILENEQNKDSGMSSSI